MSKYYTKSISLTLPKKELQNAC